MRYIGNKENIVEQIYNILNQNGVSGKTFFDFFAGTTSVSRFFKSKGYSICSSDFLYMSYCLQKAYIENNSEPTFDKLISFIPNNCSNSLFQSPLDIVIGYLNSLEPQKGFIYRNYTPEGTKELSIPRMYFSNENGQRIDSIRQQIETWYKEGYLLESEYFILISCLIETVSLYSNVSGVYAAFQKKWDPRAIKTLELRPIAIYNNNLINKVYNIDSMKLLDKIDVDILYLDPPYNERQYLPNYHVLETIAKYDSPDIHGVTGMRSYKEQKSRFCNSKTALEDLAQISEKARFKSLVLSYNSEGIMSHDSIIDVLSQFGSVKVAQFEYMRFKSNNNGSARNTKHVFEQVYILQKED